MHGRTNRAISIADAKQAPKHCKQKMQWMDICSFIGSIYRGCVLLCESDEEGVRMDGVNDPMKDGQCIVNRPLLA